MITFSHLDLLLVYVLTANGEKKAKYKYLSRMLGSTKIFFIVSVTALLIYEVIYFSVDKIAWVEQNESVRGSLCLH